MRRCAGVLLSCLIAATLRLAAQTAPPPAPLFTPFKANGIYLVGEKVGWTVSPPAAGELSATTFTYTISKNNAVRVASGTLDLSSAHAIIEAAIDEPAMVYVQVRAADAATGPSINLGAAVAPGKLPPSVPRPSDFDAFWDGKLNAQAAVPINPSLTPMETAIAGIELYTVRLDSLGSHVQGYLAKPARDGRFPALIIYQYAGVYALQTRTVTDRAAEGWLVFDVDSHDMPPDQATAPRDYQAVGNTDRETSYFLNMYLRDSRAVDYIAGRPDWDGRTIAVMGTSMGGQQSVVAAALNPRVTAVLVNEPAGADTNADLHGRKGGYPNWPSADPKIMQTALYFDTVNFASRIKAPAAVAMGFIDTIAPPAGIWSMLNQIRGATEAIPMAESDHNNITPQKQGAWDARWREVLAALLRGDRFTPDETWTRRQR
jgi:cephalosporin-C deacetylase-like acetyl esterase